MTRFERQFPIMENILYMSSEDLWMHLCPQYDVAPDLSADLTMSLNEYH